MKTINETGLIAATICTKVQHPQDTLTVILKGSFDLQPGQAATLCNDTDRLPPTGDEFRDDDPSKSLRYESDFAPLKPRADLLLMGTCHTPVHEAMPSCRVSFGVGAWQKSLLIQGECTVTKSLFVNKQTQAEPFTEMPLCYENSLGGPGVAENPVGKGPSGAGKVCPQPNVRPLKQSALKSEKPVGFGPLSRSWAQRMAKVGTYKSNYLKERWPWFPEDFDYGYFNAAPEDQQVDYLRGDEAMYFENLHADLAEYRCRLPGLRVRCFVNESETQVENFREVPVNLDTLWVDLDAEKLVLVWRGLTPVQSPDYEEIQQLYLVTEDLAEPARPPEYYRLGLAEILNPPAEADQEVPTEPTQKAASADAKHTGHSDALKKQLDQVLAATRKVLASTGLDSDLIENVLVADAPAAVFDNLFASLGMDPTAGAQLLQESQKKTAQMLAAHGLDAKACEQFLAPTKNAQPASTSTQQGAAPAETGAQEYQAGGDYAGADLTGVDLSGVDLTGANFSSAVLTGANLQGCNLSGADFSNAVLQQSNLSGAVLVSVKATNADFHKAVLSKADISATDLSGALLTEADLTDANLSKANAAGARFNRANLAGAILTGGLFMSADFGEAMLDNADFNGANLVQAEFGAAIGSFVRFTKADLSNLHAGAGCVLTNSDFTETSAAGAAFSNGDFSGSVFTGAKLTGAFFTAAVLRDADMCQCDLTKANLAKTDLSRAKVTQANLFKATLERATLTGADFSGSNMYEAEFLDAKFHDTRFNGANLAMTKLADTEPA